MNEQKLKDRWSLEADDPKAFAALNLAVERAKLQKGYRPGRSAAEMELQARKNDLENRQRSYIEDAQKKRDADVLNNGVAQRLDPQVDFDTHTPYIDAGRLAGKGMGELYSVGMGERARIAAVNDKTSRATRIRAAFEAGVTAKENEAGDKRRAIGAGYQTFKRKGREHSEQAARTRNAGPIDVYGLKMGLMPASMERNGQQIDVPQGGHFDDEQVFGPRVNAVAPQAKSFTPYEAPVGDGVLPNDGMEGAPDLDYREPASPRAAGPQPMRGTGGSWDEAPQAVAQAPAAPQFEPANNEPEHFNDSPMSALRGTVRAGRQLLDWMRPEGARSDAPNPNGGFYGNAPAFTDRRKPKTLIAPATRPLVAKRIN